VTLGGERSRPISEKTAACFSVSGLNLEGMSMGQVAARPAAV
jgi:hypothetical protein